MPKLNSTQSNFLKERLNQAKRDKPNSYAHPKIAEPSVVKAARQARAKAQTILDRFDKKVEKARDTRNNKIITAYRQCQEAILFGDAKKALALVVKFEKTVFLFFAAILLTGSLNAQQWTAPLCSTGNNPAPFKTCVGIYSPLTSTAALTVRTGYPIAGVWVTQTISPGVGFGMMSVSSLANPNNETPVMEVQTGTAAIITQTSTYWCNADGSQPVTVFTLSADGSMTSQVAACPVGSTPPPAVATVAPVVTPPTPPPPVVVAQAVCSPGASSVKYNADGSVDIHEGPFCMLIQAGGSWGMSTDLGPYAVFVTGDPSQALFAPGNGTNVPH